MKKRKVWGLTGIALAFLLFVATVLTPGAASAYYYSSYSSCYAYTMCPNGATIWCQVYGDSYAGTACTWYVVPGYSVSCTGYNAWGYWQSYYLTCY